MKVFEKIIEKLKNELKLADDEKCGAYFEPCGKEHKCKKGRK